MAARGYLFITSMACLIAAVLCWPRPCEKPPFWTIQDQDLMKQDYGNITIVTLLSASCPVCLWQTEALEKLSYNLKQANLTNITYHIINSNTDFAKFYIHELTSRAKTIPVYQDNDIENVWDTLEGGKDDLYIYDRCGRLTFYLPYPLSLLFQPYTLGGILSTYYDNPCGPCPVPETPIQTSNETICNEFNTTINCSNLTSFDNETESFANSSSIQLEFNLTADNNNETEKLQEHHHSNENRTRVEPEMVSKTTEQLETEMSPGKFSNLTISSNDSSTNETLDTAHYHDSNYTTENETISNTNTTTNSSIAPPEQTEQPKETLKHIFENIKNYQEALNYALRYWFMANLDVKTYERQKLQLQQLQQQRSTTPAPTLETITNATESPNTTAATPTTTAATNINVTSKSLKPNRIDKKPKKPNRRRHHHNNQTDSNTNQDKSRQKYQREQIAAQDVPHHAI